MARGRDASKIHGLVQWEIDVFINKGERRIAVGVSNVGLSSKNAKENKSDVLTALAFSPVSSDEPQILRDDILIYRCCP